MPKLMMCLTILALPVAAAAQQAGSTYPAGSNLPQRTAGEVTPKPQSQIGGSGGTAPSTAKARGQATNKAAGKKKQAAARRAPAGGTSGR